MKIKTERIGVALIAIFLVGSTLGIAFLSSTNNTSDQNTDVPNQNILKNHLTEQQEISILSRGGVILIYENSPGCVVCLEDNLRLETLTKQFSPYVFYVQLANFNQTRLTLKGYSNEETIQKVNETVVEEFICDNLAFQIQRCIVRAFPSNLSNQTKVF